MRRTSLLLTVLLSLGSFGCDPPPPSGDDTGPPLDGGGVPDGSTSDAPDGGAGDAPLPFDAGPRANGEACSAGSDCASGECVDGVCCDTACDGACQACIATLTDGDDGTCAPVLATDPEDECDAGGCLTGECGATGCAVQAAGFVCRPAGDLCDVDDACNGVDAACPPDAFAPEETVCRGSVGACDAEETCTGASPACPVDSFAPEGTSCRAAAGPCDASETCTGLDAMCPTDAFLSSFTPACSPYRCSGSAATCAATCSAQTDCSLGTVCLAGACVPGYRMFVTSTLTLPNFGGVAGADAICVAAASAAGLGTSYRAFISDSTASAASRLHRSTRPYYRVDGTVQRIIANNWTDLVDGISVAIATDEYGVPYRDGAVWTGSADNGTAVSQTCNDWTSTAMGVTGMSGNSSAAEFCTWFGPRACNVRQRLYCVEQPPPS